MVTVRDDAIVADTATQTAVFRRGFLVALTSKRDGERWVELPEPAGSALVLVYPGQPAVDVVGNLAATVSVHELSPTSAQFRCAGWDADGVLTVSEDPATGEVLVEPSAYSSRRGVLACRWRLPGVRDDLALAAPFFQGVKLPLADPLLARRWFWPQFWEAGLAILQGADGGFSVHCQDARYRYKALNIAGGELGFETEAYGPLDGSLGAGGLVWRLGCHQGDWRVPAAAYRQWLWRAYDLAEQAALRPAWLRELRFALSWYNGDPAILDALATRLDPRGVLLHYSQWRTDAYDENYPTYQPSDAAKAVIAKARAMGFHIMPHCNSVDMDPTHAAYAFLRDFEYRDVQTRRLLGWGYDPQAGGILGVPNSTHRLAGNRRRKVMVKVHPGLAMWRSILCEEIRAALAQAPTDAVFIDVTLCSHNLDNCLVEDTTASEGMNRLIRQIQGLDGGLAVGGEGLNEITMQGLSVAQAHLFSSWHASVDGLARTGGCALNDFLWGDLCRTFGYSRLSGRSEEEALRMDVHAAHNALPTVTIQTADEILNPNPAVARELERARS
jgi:hypothetical protein